MQEKALLKAYFDDILYSQDSKQHLVRLFYLLKDEYTPYEQKTIFRMKMGGYWKFSVLGYRQYLHNLFEINQIIKYGNEEGYHGSFDRNEHLIGEIQKMMINFDYQLPISLWYNILWILSNLGADEMFHFNRLEREKKEEKKSFVKRLITKHPDYQERKERMEAYHFCVLEKQKYYETSLQKIDVWVNWLIENNKADEIDDFLVFVLGMIKNDIIYDGMTDIIYTNNEKSSFCFFPEVCFDEKMQQIAVIDSNKIPSRSVDLNKNHVFVTPWHKRERLPKIFSELRKTPFKYDEHNHDAYYYKQLELCHVVGGMHSITVGIGKKEGKIKAIEVDMVPLFEHIKTDGAYWKISHEYLKDYDSDEAVSLPILRGSEIEDFRVAVLFEIARRRYTGYYS